MTEFVKEQLKDQILQNLLQDNSIFRKLTKICVPKATWTSCVTPVRGKYACLFLSHLDLFSIPVFTIYLILVRTLQSSWWQRDMCGLGYSSVGKNLRTVSKGQTWKTHADTCWSFPVSRWTIRTRTYRYHWSFTSLWGVYILVDMLRSFLSLVWSPSYR